MNLPSWNYPETLPVVAMRREIVEAVRQNQVIVVVSETGSGKTTQLPKMVAEALGETVKGRVGCTQPRRLAAVSVARRVAEELKVPLGDFVGYQVRFDEKTSRSTRIKFMTDGILLAETQADANLKQYSALILDEAHERSLNIDFLLGYLKRLLEKRPELKLVISSATLDAGAFSDFFHGAPVIEAEGRTFPVEEYFLPSYDEEDLPQHVARGVDQISSLDPRGDILIFLPGEREIRDCTEALEGRQYRQTEILPLYARLGLNEQQRIFNPGSRRRIVLATNVAETSLTIPGIVSVIDSGIARVSRWSPARGVQRLQIEEVSQASARQRKGRCGRVSEGICLRLYSEENLSERAPFTDPEIRRSSLAGVILRMKSLALPEIDEFPFLDPPAPKAVAEGYRTLREVGAVDKDKQITQAGRLMARMPIDPRLARMLLESREQECLAEILPIIAGIESSDPRERPPEKAKEADAAQARWKDQESDYRGILRLWMDLQTMRDGRGWKRNQLRKFCQQHFLNFRRVTEWANVHDELRELLVRELKWQMRPLPEKIESLAPYTALHCALLAGVPRQFGLWDRESKTYRSASGGHFAVFPGSGLFSGKRWEWVMATELVDTTRLYARRIARIDPQWVEKVAPHLCTKRYSEGFWDEVQGAVYAKETVLCGGLPIITGRRVHMGRIDPQGARRIFIREALLQGGLKGKCPVMERLAKLREEIESIEHKLRRPSGLWSEEAVIEWFEAKLPGDLCTAKAYHEWRRAEQKNLRLELQDVVLEDLGRYALEDYPDTLAHGEEEYAVYYRVAPGERDDGVTLGLHIDQLSSIPEWLPGWGVPGEVEFRAEWLIRSLPKDLRRACQPIAQHAQDFTTLWRGVEPDAAFELRLAQYLSRATGFTIQPREFELERMPEELVTKIWVCDDEEREIAFGRSIPELREKLGHLLKQRFEESANAECERPVMTAWTEGAIPVSIQTGSGTAYPALVDEGKGASVKAFSRADEAQQAHRAGQVRLAMLGQPTEVSYLKKKFPLGLMGKVELPRLGCTLDSLIALSAEGAMNDRRYEEPADFQQALTRSRGGWFEAASRLGRSLEEATELHVQIREWIHQNQKDRHLAEIAEDLEEQLGWLMRQNFAWKAGYTRSANYARYLKGIKSRLARLKSLPIAKDLEKMDRVRKFWEPWYLAWTASPEDAALWEYGWLLEEYRLSLFAPDVPTIVKVSEKRLEEKWGG
jgi:ATP-dependent helicase HrpA